MSNYQGNIVFKSSGKDLSKTFLEKALQAYPSCAGIAILSNPSEQDFINIFSQDSAPPVDEVENLLSGYTDNAAVLFFGNFPEKFSNKNLQPITVLFDNDGNPTMVGFIEGEVLAKDKKSDESPQLQFFNRYIIPTVTRAEKENGDDLGETHKALASDESVADLLSNALDEATAILVSNYGVITFGKKGTEFPWGWATDDLGLATATEPQKGAGKTSGFGGNLARPQGLQKEPKTETSQVSLQTPNDDKPVATDGPGLEGKDWEWASPPSSFTKNQKRNFYMEAEIWDSGRKEWAHGVAPENYKDCPKVKMRKKPIKSLQDIPKDVVTGDKQVTADVLPVVSPKSIEWLQKNLTVRQHVQKTLNEGVPVLDPKRAKALEEHWPTFVETGGLKDLRTVLSFTHEDFADIIRETPDAALVLLEDLTMFMYNTLKQRNDLAIPASGKLTIGEKHELAKDELKPEKATGTTGKPGGFGSTLSLNKKK